MKNIIIFSFALLSLSVSFADINGTVIRAQTSEFTSVRNLPVIIDNEVLSNDRCRLHLDTGKQLDVSCQPTLDEV